MTKRKPKSKLVKDVGGRPPMFKTSDEIKDAINEYFQNGVKKRKVIVGKGVSAKLVELPVPTITGLALYLGFASRQSFYDYEKKNGFAYIIKRARLFIECEYEEQLQAGNTIGAIFALKQMGWADTQELKVTGLDKLGERLTAANKRVENGSG